MNDAQNTDLPTTFEAAMSELEHIISKLETGDVPLEETVKLYERGETLRAFCAQKLQDAEMKVSQIQQNKDGSVSEIPFDDA